MALSQLDKAEIKFMILNELTLALMEVRDNDYYDDFKSGNFVDNFLAGLIKAADTKTGTAAGELQKMQQESAEAKAVDDRIKPEF